MLSIKLQNKLTNFNNTHYVKKLEKSIIKALYKGNIGPERAGIEEQQLKSTKNVAKYISSNTAFMSALSNLKFRHLIEYSDANPQFPQKIRLTSSGIDFYTQRNQIHLKPTVITTAIATAFSFLANLLLEILMK